MDNPHIAAAFDELADLLEINGENPFKTRAYRTFAQSLREMAEPVTAVAARGELGSLPGVGKAIAQKVVDIAGTGTCPALEKARAAVPGSLRDLLSLPGLGAKSVRLLWKEAGVTTLGELVTACEDNRLAALAGLGAKKQARLLGAARDRLRAEAGVLLGTALEAARGIEAALRAAGAREVAVVGDARRGVEVVPELVMLASGLRATRAAAAISGLESLGGAEAKVTGAEIALRVHDDLDVRIEMVDAAAWLHALVTRTGDAAHVKWLDERAGGKLREACGRAADEAALYAAFDLPFTPPELRVGAAPTVPDGLLLPGQVRGVFHVHTNWSDGTASILDMARAAAQAGYAYVGISDHSQAASYANGLDVARLVEQKAAIAIARREVPSCAILHGVEVDILPDGSLDLPDEVLLSLDFVIASVHSRMGMGHEEMTRRIVRAVSHPLVTILGHPTGRLLLGRKGYTFDVTEVARAAAANDTYLEINANAQRLDLSEPLVREASRAGARFAIDPDAHATRGLDDVPLGIAMARRAGLTRAQLLNARDRDEVEKLLSTRKKKAIARLESARST